MSDMSFVQSGPRLTNQYATDFWLREILNWQLPDAVLESAAPELHRMGELAAGEMLEQAWLAELQPPKHVPLSPWGERIDRIEISAAWKYMEKVAAEEGIVATGYERKFNEFSRIIQFAKLYLYHPSSAIFSCPLAMTDGAAKILEKMAPAHLKARAFSALTSRDPKKFWTSGQWMTEKTGGSDVSETSTIARPVRGGFELHGIKWFTSSVTSPMALALGRIEGAPNGSKGLSLFYVETYKEDGRLNGIEILRLKDKLGTKALPTAELRLSGTFAELLGESGQGVKNIATMLNITRLYNSVCALGYTRRALALAGDYSRRRQTFSRPLFSHAAFLTTFSAASESLAGGLASMFYAARLLGQEEAGSLDTRGAAVLRLLIPLLKMITAKDCVRETSEMLEVFGGAGYCEDTRLPVLLRDAQVLPIWEGPTNVLSLDVLRVIGKGEVLAEFFADVESHLAAVSHPELRPQTQAVRQGAVALRQYVERAASQAPDIWQSFARQLAWSLWELHTSALVLAMTDKRLANVDPAKQATLLAMARRWTERSRPQMSEDPQRHAAESAHLASIF